MIDVKSLTWKIPLGKHDDQVDSISQALAHKFSGYTLDNFKLGYRCRSALLAGNNGLDFHGEGSVHADVVGGRESIGPTPKTAPHLVAGLQVVEAPRMARGRASGAPPDGKI